MPPFERLVIILQVKYASICIFEKFVKTFVQLILQTSFLNVVNCIFANKFNLYTYVTTNLTQKSHPTLYSKVGWF